MRRASLPLLVLAALASLAAGLAGCSVNVEGAKCHVVGATDECPSGQRCGTDWTCSVRAAACQPCVVRATACRAAPTCELVECTADVDPVCGTWKPASAGAGGLQTCQVPVGGIAPECACVNHVVDPAGGTCTHPSITSAIAAATRFPAPLVVLGGASYFYGNAIEDAAPIVVPAGVTLLGDEATTATAATRIIMVQGPGPEGLQVHPGAVVRGLAVERADAAGPTIGVLLTGGAAASGNTLMSVRVDAGAGGGGFATGLRVAGANAVAVSDVLVKGATIAGLEVNRLGAGDVVVVTGSTFDQNQVGVSLVKGDLTLSGSTVKGSGWEGVVAATGPTGLTILDGQISRNGTVGLAVSTNERLSVQRTRICKNAGTNRGPVGQSRKVGGIFAQGNPPTALAFSGNTLHENGGDQVYVINAAGTWNLSGAAGCLVSDRNVFATYAPPGVGVAVDGATVSALFNYWNNAFPMLNTDYTAAGGSVDVGTQSGAFDYCPHTLVADPTCPLP
jgi:hypothetical protein